VSGDRVTSFASMKEWEKRCNDYSGELVNDLANEVLRLRAAGDALAEVADEWPELVEAWQEARK